MRISTSKKGFTIVELLLVIVGIGILASITLMQFNGAQAKARDAQRRTDISNITKALEQYYADNGSYPVASSSGSVINGSWYSSQDASWTTFAAALNGMIDTLPTDPKAGVNSNPINANNYAYAYYSGGSCGRTAGRWYILVYRFESSTAERFADGECTSGQIGDNYYSLGASYYRITK